MRREKNLRGSIIPFTDARNEAAGLLTRDHCDQPFPLIASANGFARARIIPQPYLTRWSIMHRSRISPFLVRDKPPLSYEHVRSSDKVFFSVSPAKFQA